MRKIVTYCIAPPIPDRRTDWCAYLDGEEEAGGYGYGATREEAIADFLAEAICDGRVTPAESLLLASEAAPLLKPTCDEAGHWSYVPAVEIDGPLAMERASLAIAATNLDATLMDAVASALNVPVDPARAAVEGAQLGEVA